MPSQHFPLEDFLRSVYGTEPFLDYCQSRSIPFAQVAGGTMPRGDARRWGTVLAQLTREQRARVEWELAAVDELADRESLTHLLAAIEGQELPSDRIPGGAALALWFFLHHPEAFHTVSLHREMGEGNGWRNARAPSSLVLDDLPRKSALLAGSVRECFRLREGTGRFCEVEARRLNGACCFVAHIADRLHLIKGFTDEGEQTTERLRPALSVFFVYYPQDGTILLKSSLHAEDRILELIQCFGRSVLGVQLGADCLGHPFALDLLKVPPPFLPDAEDMELVRIKTLQFRYPERHGRRQIKLETLASDAPSAILDLIETHMSADGVLDEVQVCYAELQVLLKIPDQQSRSQIIRLWPNRCNLNETPLGERLRACLKRWGLVEDRGRSSRDAPAINS